MSIQRVDYNKVMYLCNSFWTIILGQSNIYAKALRGMLQKLQLLSKNFGARIMYEKLNQLLNRFVSLTVAQDLFVLPL